MKSYARSKPWSQKCALARSTDRKTTKCGKTPLSYDLKDLWTRRNKRSLVFLGKATHVLHLIDRDDEAPEEGLEQLAHGLLRLLVHRLDRHDDRLVGHLKPSGHFPE